MNRISFSSIVITFGILGSLLAIAVYIILYQLDSEKTLVSKEQFPKISMLNDDDILGQKCFLENKNSNKLMFVSCSGFFDE